MRHEACVHTRQRLRSYVLRLIKWETDPKKQDVLAIFLKTFYENLFLAPYITDTAKDNKISWGEVTQKIKVCIAWNYF